MKLNIFKIPKQNIEELKKKLSLMGLKIISSNVFKNWKADFYFSENVDPIEIPWVETYIDFFTSEKPKNKVFFGVYLWGGENDCFALSYGKSHFYLRPFCDQDFGTEMAKRIADSKDIRQKSSKKFAGRKKKEIKSYTKNSRLDIESGESIDYLQSAVAKDQKIIFGKSGKFGSSILLNPEIERSGMPDFLDSISRISIYQELFKLPRTIILNDPITSAVYDEKLVNEIIQYKDGGDFISDGHELIGIDFIFSGQEKYSFYLNGSESEDIEELSLQALNNFISEFSIPKDQVLNIRIKVIKEDQKIFSKSLKEALDFIVDDENVILSQGKWMKFNEDYLEQLNEYVDDSVELEKTENELSDVNITEPEFNKNLEGYGYEDTHTNFESIKIAPGTLVEAWDSKKGDTVYAIKFGTPQKLGYVCDQANNTLELISKKGNLRKLDADLKSYCIWAVIRRKEIPKKISNINSIIFKQKIESWARRCWELGITPKIKFSKKV